MQDRFPTMKDVARRAGVSPMTVSRALRGEGTVDETLRSRVEDAVRDLGYRRNDWARGLRSRAGSGLVGLVVGNLSNPFYSELATGMDEVAAIEGLQVLLGSSQADGAREADVVEGLLSRRVEGLVVVPSGVGHQHLRRLRDVALVLATSPVDDIAADTVLVDDFGGARQAALRLRAEGHRRVALLGLPRVVWTGDERRRGFRTGWREGGGADEDVLDAGDGDGRADQLDRLARTPQPPTAVFAINNRATLIACEWVAATGEQLRVIGFDAITTAALFAVPPSLVTYDAAEIGRRAMHRVVARVRREAGPPVRDVLPTRLVDYGPRA